MKALGLLFVIIAVVGIFAYACLTAPFGEIVSGGGGERHVISKAEQNLLAYSVAGVLFILGSLLLAAGFRRKAESKQSKEARGPGSTAGGMQPRRPGCIRKALIFLALFALAIVVLTVLNMIFWRSGIGVGVEKWIQDGDDTNELRVGSPGTAPVGPPAPTPNADP